MIDADSLEERFRQLRGLCTIARAGDEQALDRLRSDLHALENDFRSALLRLQYQLQDVDEQRREIEALHEQIKGLAEPPLLHATLIGVSRRQQDAYVVDIGSQRYDVRAMPQAGEQLAALGSIEGFTVAVTPGDHVIVDAIGPSRHGESAEVLDVLQGGNPDVPDRLLIRSGGGEPYVVELVGRLAALPEKAAPPAESRPSIGDLVLVDSLARIVLDKLPPRDFSELQLETDPEDRYEDIAGLDDKIQVIRDAIELPHLKSSRFEAYKLDRPAGILLHGPPGCGKTMIGRAVANGLKSSLRDQLDRLIEGLKLYQSLTERDADAAMLAAIRPFCPAAAAPGLARRDRINLLRAAIREGSPGGPIQDNDPSGAPSIDLDRVDETIRQLTAARDGVHGFFLNIKGPELLSKWVGEAESRVRQIFVEARRKASYTTPVVVFFDEIESMFQRRGSGVSSDMEKTMVPQLLTELDGIEELKNVIVIGASNRHELLDPALMRAGRLDIKIKIDRPDRAAATSIFLKYLAPSLPFATEGLDELADAAFDRDVAASLRALVEHEAFLTVQRGASARELLPLAHALPEELFPDVSRSVREDGLRKLAQQPDQRRVALADLAAAVVAVVGQQRSQAATAQSLPAVTEEIQLLIPVSAAESPLGTAQLPNLPLAFEAMPAETRAEHHAKLLVDLAVETMFSPSSQLRARVLAGCRREFTFTLQEFVSGALISNAVSRAKWAALKRESADDATGPVGITIEDVLMGIRVEYEENKDHFVTNKVEISRATCETCRRSHDSVEEYEVEVVLGRGTRDRWHLPRRRPHERSRNGQVTPETLVGIR